MTSRERMLAAINHQKLDRIPTDMSATPEVVEMLRKHFGSDAEVRAKLHIDGSTGVGPKYVGPALPALPPGESVNYWGIRMRQIHYGTGAYDEAYFHPLAEARTINDLKRYPWPRADWFDLSEMRAAAQAGREQQVVWGGYMAPFYFHNLLRGLEQSLLDPLDDPEFTHYLVNRITDFFCELYRRVFETCDGLIDLAEVTDDYGSQTGPLISLETFREFYKPHLQRLMDLCHGHGIKVLHHDDGAIRQFLPDLVAMGIDILNPVQATCPGMEMVGLKRDFGRAVCFHGGIDNQHVLPHGTPADVRAAVRHAIDALASDGTGYIVAPCHALQPVTPLENILALYDEAWNYGRYS